MRFANQGGRAVLVTAEELAIDVETASSGRFGPDPASVFAVWGAFRAWAEAADLTAGAVSIDRSVLGPPSPSPRQIFAIGLNYRDHAAEASLPIPDGVPPVFTKFQSSLSGPNTAVVLPPGGNTDWEVELVVVIATEASAVAEADAWGCVAGLTVGQDISERITQRAGPVPQFSLGKSYAGFSPIGPWLVTPDEFTDPDDLELGCLVDDEEVQRSRTSDLVFSVPALISLISHRVRLFPGDLIFTGTPAGVGFGRSPKRYLKPGEQLRSWVEGIGELHQTFVAVESSS